jgi:xylulose-5-phosphate/fructose-6-phosphate phosphoketolase
VIVAGKQPAPQWLTMDEAIAHCTRGAGIWEWASNDGGERPDVVLACAGDVPTLETLAAVDPAARAPARAEGPRRQRRRPDEAAAATRAPARPERREFDALFTTDKPVIFAYHGYPWLIHRLTYRRTNHANLHVRGYKEEGTTTTPFDMVVLNDLDRFHLVMDVIDRVPSTATPTTSPSWTVRTRTCAAPARPP